MKIKRLVVGSYQANCYIVSYEQEAIIIDPGDHVKQIRAYIEKENLKVMAVCLTHGHFDHIGAIDAIEQHYHCPIYLHKEDHICLKNELYNLSGKQHPLHIHATVLEAPEYLDIGHFKIHFIHCPGHSQGSCMIELLNENVIFSGDVLFKGSIGRFDFIGSSKHDTFESIQKIKKIDGDYTIYPGHDMSTTLSDEKAYNPYF